MEEKSKDNIVYIGIIPGVKNLAGVPFRTDLSGSYHKDLEGCRQMCLINGGRSRYFFIEERYFFFDKPPGEKLGDIRRVYSFNRRLQEGSPEVKQRTRLALSFVKNRRR